MYTSYEEKFKRNATIFECTTCLSDTGNKPGLGTNLFFGQAPENASTITSRLLHYGAYERVYEDYSDSGRSAFATRLYSSQNLNSHFLNDRNSALEDGQPDDAPEDAPRVKAAEEVELYAAHLAARLPLLPVIGADSQLPKVTRDPGASERPYVAVALEVKWRRTAGVLIGILFGQIIAIAVVKWMCQKVFLRDHDSFLSVSRLLRTAMLDLKKGSSVKAVSTANGEELAAALDERLGGTRLRYGTRNRGGEFLEVDLWHDVDNRFPPASYA